MPMLCSSPAIPSLSARTSPSFISRARSAAYTEVAAAWRCVYPSLRPRSSITIVPNTVLEIVRDSSRDRILSRSSRFSRA
jgi:hypothetical protein